MERSAYVGECPEGSLSSRPSLARWNLDYSHGWILQVCPTNSGRHYDSSSLNCRLSKIDKVSVLPVQCSSFIHFSILPGYGWEIQLTFWCCSSLRKPTWRQKSCCGFYVILFIIFALPLCFLCNCDDCLLLDMRFAVQSAPKSHKQAAKLMASSHHYYNWPVRTLQLSKITPLYSRV